MELQEFFHKYSKAAIAFSGGVDSAYLLYAAKACGADVKAYYVKSAFQPQFELDHALRLAREVGAEMKILPVDVLACGDIVKNPPDRCYYCKTRIFTTIWNAVREDGYTVLLDGTNASDQVDDRPGMKALKELEVLSPLRICGLTKTRIRELSREAGLFTADKPSYACLATRIPAGMHITAEMLETTEKCETCLSELGFRDFRIRMTEGGAAKLQIPEEQLMLLIEKREQVLAGLKPYYKAVTLDLEVR